MIRAFFSGQAARPDFPRVNILTHFRLIQKSLVFQMLAGVRKKWEYFSRFRTAFPGLSRKNFSAHPDQLSGACLFLIPCDDSMDCRSRKSGFHFETGAAASLFAAALRHPGHCLSRDAEAILSPRLGHGPQEHETHQLAAGPGSLEADCHGRNRGLFQPGLKAGGGRDLEDKGLRDAARNQDGRSASAGRCRGVILITGAVRRTGGSLRPFRARGC